MAGNRKEFVIKMEMKGGKLAISELKNIEGATKKADKATKGMMTSMDKMKSMLMAGGVFYMAQRAIRGMVSAAIDLEAQLAQVSTMLTKQTMIYMPQYRREIIRMAADFGESTATLSKGTYDILSASIDASKAMDFLRISAKAAKAGIADTGIAADALTTIINSYQMQAEEASKVSDILFGVIKRGKTTFIELAPQIGMVTASAAQAGLRLEELGAFLATVTRAGVRTERAVTALVNVLVSFLKPTTASIKAAEQFGLELSSNTLKTIGLIGVMEKINNASAEQLALVFPNIRGLRGIAAAMSDTAGYAKDLDMMLNSVGLTQEAFQKQMDITQTKLSRAWQITINWGRELGSVFKIVLDIAAEAIIALDEVAAKTPKVAGWKFGTYGAGAFHRLPGYPAPIGPEPLRKIWPEHPMPSAIMPERIPPPPILWEFRGREEAGAKALRATAVAQQAAVMQARETLKQMPEPIMPPGLEDMLFRPEEVFDKAAEAMENFSIRAQSSAMILGDSFANAFAMMSSGAASAGDAISKSMLGALGQIATYWGQYFIGVGTAGMFIPGGQVMWGAVAKGAALMALGGTLSGLSGRIGGRGGGGYGGGGYGGYSSPVQEGGTPATQVIIIKGGDGESIDSALNRAGIDRALRNKLYELGRTGDLDFLND